MFHLTTSSIAPFTRQQNQWLEEEYRASSTRQSFCTSYPINSQQTLPQFTHLSAMPRASIGEYQRHLQLPGLGTPTLERSTPRRHSSISHRIVIVDANYIILVLVCGVPFSIASATVFLDLFFCCVCRLATLLKFSCDYIFFSGFYCCLVYTKETTLFFLNPFYNNILNCLKIFRCFKVLLICQLNKCDFRNKPLLMFCYIYFTFD